MAMRARVPLLRLRRRVYSTFSAHDGIIEIDLSSPSPSPSSEEASALKRLDDVVQRLMVQKATPDWLPFRPGASFWVPPRTRRNNLADLLSGLAENLPDHRHRHRRHAFRFSADGKMVEDSLSSSDDEDEADDGIGEIGMNITDDDEDDDKDDDEDGDKENSADSPTNVKG